MYDGIYNRPLLRPKGAKDENRQRGAFCRTVFRAPFQYPKTCICDALQKKVTYFGKCNFAVEQKIAGNLKKVKFQILMDMCSRYIREPCTLRKNSMWFDSVWVNMWKRACPPSLIRKGNLSWHNGSRLLFIHLHKNR